MSDLTKCAVCDDYVLASDCFMLPDNGAGATEIPVCQWCAADMSASKVLNKILPPDRQPR